MKIGVKEEPLTFYTWSTPVAGILWPTNEEERGVIRSVAMRLSLSLPPQCWGLEASDQEEAVGAASECAVSHWRGCGTDNAGCPGWNLRLERMPTEPTVRILCTLAILGPTLALTSAPRIQAAA